MHTEKSNVTVVKPYMKGAFFSALSPAALADFDNLVVPISQPANKVLFTETQENAGVMVVVEGEVKLSINSSDGRRLSLRIARAGEVLGLSSTLSGNGYEMTADTLYPAKIAHVSRQTFLHFMARHPEVYEVVTREISRSFNLACEQLRMVGLSTSVPERLARLLIGWSDETPQQKFDEAPKQESGVRCRVSLTHEQIGEFIGASRETVTRTLSIFKNRQLVAQHGCTITIPSRMALEHYARG
ncbi:MAG: Crp/Fnr family transcriptional regulator [Terracidiphilus sp.]|jgi:CRP/FNR family transcriptional regulator